LYRKKKSEAVTEEIMTKDWGLFEKWEIPRKKGSTRKWENLDFRASKGRRAPGAVAPGPRALVKGNGRKKTSTNQDAGDRPEGGVKLDEGRINLRKEMESGRLPTAAQRVGEFSRRVVKKIH